MKVMVVDDEKIVLDSCRKVFSAEGWEVIVEPSADSAIEALTTVRPSLFLIDMKMPVHDGMYLMDRIKEKAPGVPVIVMSGYHTREAIEESKKKGAVLFLMKPFTPDELVEAVRQVLEPKGA
ncbi:MAG: response regulator [Thermodesulfobacteriota bacterium]